MRFKFKSSLGGPKNNIVKEITEQNKKLIIVMKIMLIDNCNLIKSDKTEE